MSSLTGLIIIKVFIHKKKILVSIWCFVLLFLFSVGYTEHREKDFHAFFLFLIQIKLVMYPLKQKKGVKQLI